tara:strand:- start:2603 stop:3058 length:456 start_codon:yes stop_codon:yes gene_type:complete
MAKLEISNDIANLNFEYDTMYIEDQDTPLMTGFGSESILSFQRSLYTFNENIKLKSFNFKAIKKDKDVYELYLSSIDGRVMKLHIHDSHSSRNPYLSIVKCSFWSNSEMNNIFKLKDDLIRMCRECMVTKLFVVFHNSKDKKDEKDTLNNF